jgi:hypothetical protein
MSVYSLEQIVLANEKTHVENSLMLYHKIEMIASLEQVMINIHDLMDYIHIIFLCINVYVYFTYINIYIYIYV